MTTPAVFPVERRAIGVARELIAGTPVLPTVTVPVDKFQPEDKVTGLIDKSWRASMAEEYGYLQGPYSGTLDIGGPFYADTIGHFLYNLLGDYTVTGTAAGPNTTTTGALAPGATTIPVTLGTGFAANQWVQVDTAAGAEVVQVQTVAANTITLMAATPIRLNHASAVAVTNTTGPYTHVFSLLNSPLNGAQPPTHTLTDVTGVTAGTGARVYPSACISEVTLTGNSSQLLTWESKADTWRSSPAASQPVVAPSNQPTQAAWNSVVGIGGPASGATQNKYTEEWAITLTRKTTPVWTAQGQQQPYIIVRGGVTASAKLTFGPVPDESPLLALLDNTEPQTQFVATGPNGSLLTIDSQVTAYDTSKLNDGKDAFGFDVTGKLIANVSNVGASGGFSPVKVTLVNAVPSY